MPVTVGTDSYVSLEDAQAYFDNRLYADAWTETDDPTREKALKMATKAIDRQVLSGQKYDTDQELAFPRMPDTEVPKAVKNAQCEEALALLDRGNSTRRKLQQEGVSSIKTGSVSESYSSMISHFNPGQLLSLEAYQLLTPWLAGPVSMK